MADLVEIRVRKKTINCQIQTGDSVGYTFTPALESLLYRNS